MMEGKCKVMEYKMKLYFSFPNVFFFDSTSIYQNLYLSNLWRLIVLYITYSYITIDIVFIIAD